MANSTQSAAKIKTEEQSPAPANKPKPFTPKFDVKETNDTYELHGDLPGLEQKAICIEFTDAETLCIRGKIEQHHTNLKKWSQSQQKQAVAVDENAKEGGEVSMKDEGKWWVEEREFGEFVRMFTFPVKVDQEKVWAEMRMGVLSVVVPKLKARKIPIFINWDEELAWLMGMRDLVLAWLGLAFERATTGFDERRSLTFGMVERSYLSTLWLFEVSASAGTRTQ